MRRRVCVGATASSMGALLLGACTSVYSASDVDAGGTDAASDAASDAPGLDSAIVTDASLAPDAPTSAQSDAGVNGAIALPIDCDDYTSAIFCDDFDNRPSDTTYMTSGSGLVTISGAHFVSGPSSLQVVATTGTSSAAFTKSVFGVDWSISFDVDLDDVVGNVTFAEVDVGSSTFAIEDLNGSINVNGLFLTSFTAGTWLHLVVFHDGGVLKANANGSVLDFDGAPISTTVTLSLGVLDSNGASTIWFDDVLAQ